VKVLLTGAAGQLGRELQDGLGHHEVVALDRGQLDITDPTAVADAVRRTRPEVIVNAAAWTAVDDCEGDPDRADLVNGRAVHHLVTAAETVDARVVQVSTDYVFDGTLDRPYVEDDQTNPQSAYGRSKLLGEQATRPVDTIVRTSWVCGAHGPNMVKTILRLAESHPVLQFVDDQIGHPTFTVDLAAVMARLVDDELAGVFHVTNQGAVSWYTFAQEVLEAAGHDPSRVHPVSTADLRPPRPAPRPANSVLENAALRAAGIPLAPDHRESLARLVAVLQAEPQ
jgi:dTDP-4-dehydrorhamnose reductase